ANLCAVVRLHQRAFGDVHDCCTRNHRRKRLWDLVVDVEEHLYMNGLWKYQLSQPYYEPAVAAAVQQMAQGNDSASLEPSLMFLSEVTNWRSAQIFPALGYQLYIKYIEILTLGYQLYIKYIKILM